MASSRILGAFAAVLLAAPAAAPAQPATDADQALRGSLARAMRPAGPFSGAHVFNVSEGRTVFRWRSNRSRILASNTKLFTTAAALGRLGPERTLATELLASGSLDPLGVWHGDLYLRGGGDPTFGSRRFGLRAYGGGGAIEALVDALEGLGVLEITGRVYGDESRFDSLRGVGYSGFRASIYVGPLSALAYNRGLARESGSAFQSNPPLFAAQRLDAELRRRGIVVGAPPRAGRTPPDARPLARVDSPPLARLVRITNKPSDNFFAEMLLKGLAADATGRGTTAAGARLAAGFARRLGAPASLADGSGLSRANRATPRRLVALLLAMSRRPESPAFLDSLAIAGRDGTLARRMRRGPARGRCRGKTGTLSNVSALSGFCRARSGDTYAFSILMNGVNPVGARRLQDRMAQAIAGVRE